MFDDIFLTFSFGVGFLFFPSFSTVGPLGHLAPATYPHGRGRLTLLRRAHQTFWCSPVQWSLPFWGPWTLAQILPKGKRRPQSGLLESHARVQQVVLFQDDLKHRQELRQSSFPFSERTYTGSPSEYKRFPPTGEKPQDPWGPS